ncbi:MAG: GldG family protein [Lachnospiraceae bacterium]|nr:GldG family protein [Lachnospiraceae bacterium]
MAVPDEKSTGKKNRKEKKEKAGGSERKHSITWNRNMKTLRNGSYSVAISAVVIVVVVLLNMIVAQIPTKYTQFDISTGKLYTIGDDTINALEKLDSDITIYHVVQSGNEDSNIEKLLEQYEANSKHIKVVKKDPVVYPSFVTSYSEEGLSENSLIVECGERNKVIAYSSIYETTIDYSTYQQSVSGFDGEGQITSAISYVTSDSLPVVYYVEGHNEVSIPSGLQDRVEKANIELKALSLLTADEVPEDAAGLLMNSPEADYSKEEVKKIEEYLAKGGRAMILTDYIGKDLPNYQSILAAYGVEVTDGIVVENDKNHYVQMPYYLVPNINYAEVTSGMTGGSQYVLLSGCQGFSTSEDVRDTVNVSEILTTSDDAYVKPDPEKMTTYEKEDGDEDGPFAVAALISEVISIADGDLEDDTAKTTDGSEEASESASAQQEAGNTKETRIVCFASSSILDESFNNSVADGNYTLYTNSLNWLVDTDEAATVSIASKSMETQYLTVTAARGVFFAIILCIVLPVACLVVGGVICYRRKRR